MENGWWASSRREEDANLHVQLLKERNERYSPRVVGLVSIWATLTIGLVLLPLPGLAVVVGSAGIAFALARLTPRPGDDVQRRATGDDGGLA